MGDGLSNESIVTIMSTSQPPAPPKLPESAYEPIPSLAEQLVEIAAIAGGLAHEIRNPLSTLKVNLQLLDEDWQQVESPDRRRPADPRDVARRSRQRLAVLLAESKRLERILEDFLRYVGKGEIECSPQDINLVIRELGDFFHPQADESNLRFHVRLADRPVVCNIDRGLIKAAVLNLLINAQQAMPDGGELIARVGVERDTLVRIDIIDTGPGIPDELKERVFDAYYSTKKAGSGLGLAQTRQMIRQHGGRIHLTSEPGRGSCFTILLPRLPESSEDRADVSPPVDSSAPTR